MIDLKATLQKANITAYRLSRIIDRPTSQIYDWTSGKVEPSPLSEDRIRKILEENSIDIIEK